jgi:hypothetical protein
MRLGLRGRGRREVGEDPFSQDTTGRGRLHGARTGDRSSVRALRPASTSGSSWVPPPRGPASPLPSRFPVLRPSPSVWRPPASPSPVHPFRLPAAPGPGRSVSPAFCLPCPLHWA